MIRRALGPLLAALLGVLVLPGCEQVMGVDFTSYKLNPPCSPLASSCPSPTACLYDTTKQTFGCAKGTGTATLDQPCKDEAACAPGFACSIFMNNTSGHCTPYCTSSEDCGNGRSCFEFEKPRKTGTGTPVGACGPLDNPCDPLVTSSTCVPNGRCTLLDSDYTVCIPVEDTRGPGSACTYLSECREGTSCIGSADAGYYCRTLCKVGVTTCNTGTCTAFATPITLDGEQIGYCP